jgi:hypothetical protein
MRIDLARRIRECLQRSHDSRDAWIEATFDLGRFLKAAREALPAHQSFGRWLDENGIELDKNNRAALIYLAKHEQKAREYFNQKPESWSWRHAWETLLAKEALEEACSRENGKGLRPRLRAAVDRIRPG